jgi:hypothetical protein
LGRTRRAGGLGIGGARGDEDGDQGRDFFRCRVSVDYPQERLADGLIVVSGEGHLSPFGIKIVSHGICPG